MSAVGGSQQLRLFRRAVRDGCTLEQAAIYAGISLGEARLHVAEDQRNPPPPEAFELIGHHQGETIMPKVDAQFENDPENDDPLINLASETLRGDTRDSLLAWFKAQPKAWPFLSEREQRDLANAVDAFSAQLVRGVSEIIAAGERPCIIAKLVEYKEKDGLEAKLKLAGKDTNVIELHKACGKEVLIVTSGAEDYLGEGGPAEIDADQPHFPNLDRDGAEPEFPED